MKFRVGVIGYGRMANTIEYEQIARRKERPYRGGLALPYSHAAGYAVVEETEIVAACDIHEGRLKAFMERWNVPRGYNDYRELIDAEKPDILSITTRPEQHAEQMIYGANHGVKGMYAEKPLCMSLMETDAIREAFERNNVHLEYGPIYRHWTAYQQARTIAESGELGELKLCTPKGGRFLDLFASTGLSQSNFIPRIGTKLNCYNIPVLSIRLPLVHGFNLCTNSVRTSQASRSVSGRKTKAGRQLPPIRNFRASTEARPYF